MSDNSYTGTYGPSTPGTLNVIAGQTYGVACSAPGASFAVFNSPGACAAPGVTPTLPGSPLPLAAGQGTMFSDADPYFDVCTNQSINSQMAGANIGDVLGSHGITWGFFTGGFASPGYVPGNPASDTLGGTECSGSHNNIAGASVKDYIPHHEPALTAPGQCGNGSVTGRVPVGPGGVLERARCGYGVRVPLLVISPYSKQNFVDHAVSDQSSVVPAWAAARTTRSPARSPRCWISRRPARAP